MKTSILKKILLILLPGILSSLLIRAQVADWSFDNILSGTGSANSTSGNASLGSRLSPASISFSVKTAIKKSVLK